MMAAGALGTLGVAAAAVFGVQGVTSTTVVGQASPAEGVSVPAGFVHGYGHGGTPFSTGGPGGTASTDPTTAVPPGEQVGVVVIDTVLQYQNARAAGTGMVLTAAGEILTNNHVINGATSISVTVASTGATYPATVVGTDPTDDVAVLQLSNASGLQTARLSTAAAWVGEPVVAVGNAGGTGTLTAASGTVVALNQSITASDESGGNTEQLSGLIETDAAVQPGDSGGPLYGPEGTVIGMDTAAASGGAAQAYAIPIAAARAVAAQIEGGVDNATIHQGNPGFLGVSLEGAAGTTVAGVLPGGAAANAGITPGDTITSIGGTPITSPADLSSVLAAHGAGDRVTVTWTTATGSEESATVTLGAGPAD